jgi:hypothetical protein
MKTTKLVFALMIALAGITLSESALAWRHGPRVGVGFGFGVPYAAYPYPSYYPPYAYYPAYSYYPQPVVVQQQPTVYVEQPAQQPQQASGYWYYCNDSRAYYPYVKECPAGWQRVAPQPQN